MTGREPGDQHVEFFFDLAAHEASRLAAVLGASTDWDPAAVLADEARAHRMLYSGLDAQQQAMYQMLIETGVIDPGAQDAA